MEDVVHVTFELKNRGVLTECTEAEGAASGSWTARFYLINFLEGFNP